jgi:S-adenosylmethionine-diacylglycerol 3-amino-3-carboxypropyl transferase
MERFFSTLNYAAANEDGRSELRALSLTPSDTVVCITGSGSRTLDLLAAGPREILSIDLNPCQSYILELKLRAIRNLDHAAWLRFLGIEPDDRRWQVYARLRLELSPDARAFWDAHSADIEKGIVYQGRWERYFRILAIVLRLARGRTLRQMMDSADLAEQGSLYRAAWDGLFWRGFIRTIALPQVWKYVFRDPGFFRFVPDDFCVGSYLLDRFEKAFTCRLLRESPFMSLLLGGRYRPERCLPFHLAAKQYPALQRNAGRVRIITAPLEQYLHSLPSGSIQAASLSDVGSYVDGSQHARLWDAILHACGPEARICERQFLVKRELPPSAAAATRRHHGVEEQLANDDDAAFYSFIVASIKGGPACT